MKEVEKLICWTEWGVALFFFCAVGLATALQYWYHVIFWFDKLLPQALIAFTNRHLS